MLLGRTKENSLTNLPISLSPDAISDRDFDLIRTMIFEEAGISLSDAKRTLVCSRLAKRLRSLRLKSYSEYLNFLANRDPSGTERQVMINCLTTNKTDFFREPHHFDFLRQQVYPQIENTILDGGPRRVRIWSAACSTGEEPYTIAMTILEHFQSLRGWDIEIVASDINTEVLNKAREGIYSLDRIEGLDLALKRKYFLRGKGRLAGSCQVAPQVKELVTFRQLNFMDSRWPVEGSFDAVFCRNVLIYFNTETQQKLLPRLTEKIAPGGYLMLGHSENLPWLADTMTPLGQTIHVKGAQPKTSGWRLTSQRAASTTPTSSVDEPKSPSLRSALGKVAKPRALHKKEITAGQILASAEMMEIATTLGSCVAVCLFDPIAKIGGMNHFMLPIHASDLTVCGRYGVHAMELLINEIAKLGGDRRRLRAKAFGGSSVINLTGATTKVGKINADFIRKFLSDERIPIDGEKLGGMNPLRVHFLPVTGVAYVKPVTQTRTDIDREEQFLEQVSSIATRESEILLF